MKYKKIFLPLLLIIILLIPFITFGMSPRELLTAVADEGGWKTIPEGEEAGPHIALLVGTVIMGFLALLGIIFMVLLIYGGYNWMLARGNEEKIKKASGILRDAVLGMILILLAGAITSYILNRL